ncbi:MAG: glutamate-5-semialdehyde dehydrogenase [Verrucomicrobia bacterium]|nr:glutamate-5-semialdehyde dehydrogenase [Verrucomicrobiota bacterium]
MKSSLTDEMITLARQAKAASRALARLTTDEKNHCLNSMAQAIRQNANAIKEANSRDMEAAKEFGLSGAMLDRLSLDDKRIESMASGLEDIAALHDPVGRVLEDRTRPNGLRLKKIAVPIGVVVIIYESRPNVTADAASLCFKTGNATILRGGKEAIHSNTVIAQVLVTAARKGLKSFPEHAIQVVQTTDREAIRELLSLTEYVDLCMPRGGEGLIRAVTECSKVPVIKHYKGVCHVYVETEADLRMAAEIVINAKVQRPSTCNAMETLLVDVKVASQFLPIIVRQLAEKNVTLHVDPASQVILSNIAAKIVPATELNWSTEYNDYILNVKVVNSLTEALNHISQYGSGHSDAIVTQNETTARTFLQEVDSAAVYWNASTRFTDGGEFGMGAEIGISTDKIGARGPMGLDELTSYKWLGLGTGQIRG